MTNLMYVFFTGFLAGIVSIILIEAIIIWNAYKKSQRGQE